MSTDFLIPYAGTILRGLATTLVLSVIALVGGGIIGLSLAVVCQLRGRLLAGAIRRFVDIVRGIPVLVQMLIWYLGSSAAGISLEPFVAASLCLTVYAAAFISEIIRGGLGAVPSGQRDAALAIGLSRLYALARIEMPQVVPIVVPALIGFYIGLVKDTSMAYILGVSELTRTAKFIADVELRPLEIYLVVAALYFLICFPLSRVVGVVDRSYQRRGLVQQRMTA